jgi:8-oxo-dGTP pyrophosphatase MutT (NUDIX family)
VVKNMTSCRRGINPSRSSLPRAGEWDGPGWTALSSEMRFTSQWFEVRRDDALLPDGSRGVYDHVVAPPAVTVLAVDEKRRAAVTRQWIYTQREPQWRLPAGRVDDVDGGPETAARRELAEEAGIAANGWTVLGAISCADSFTNHRDHAFFATGLSNVEAQLEPGEADLEVHWVPIEQTVKMVLAGLLPHAGSTFAVLLARLRGLI